MNKQPSRIGLYLVLIIALVAGYFYLNNQVVSQSNYTQKQLEQALEDNKVVDATIQQNREVPTGSVIVDTTDSGQKKVYVTDVNQAIELLNKYDIDITTQDVPGDNVFLTTLLPVLLTGALVIFLIMMMNRQMAGGGGGGNAKMMNFGKSRARMSSPDDNKKVTFDKVAGLQEEKEDLVEVVDFLKSPQKYTKVGARIPKGVLLVGPPGTGKTLLAKAVAGEAGVPFFSISGSDFVEMFVGVGASRVRDLFEEGKRHAPCIIFIDEIDAVARQRGTGMGGGFGGITYECASIFMAWELYEQYGDIRTLEKFYPGMQKYMDYMKDKGLPGTKVNPAIGPLGDWLAPEETDLLENYVIARGIRGFSGWKRGSVRTGARGASVRGAAGGYSGFAPNTAAGYRCSRAATGPSSGSNSCSGLRMSSA